MADDQYERLLSLYDRYLSRIKSGKSTQGDEDSYAKAYQHLVRAGYRQQIKGKYRG